MCILLECYKSNQINSAIQNHCSLFKAEIIAIRQGSIIIATIKTYSDANRHHHIIKISAMLVKLVTTG